MEDELDRPPHREQTADEMSERELYQWGMSKVLYHTANFRGVADSGSSSDTRKKKKKNKKSSMHKASGWELARNSAVLAQEVKIKKLSRLGVQGFEFESTVGVGEMNPAKKATAGFDHTVHQTLEDQLQLALEWALTTDKVGRVQLAQRAPFPCSLVRVCSPLCPLHRNGRSGLHAHAGLHTVLLPHRAHGGAAPSLLSHRCRPKGGPG